MSIFDNQYWFNVESNPHSKVFESVNRIINSASGSSRMAEMGKYARLYGNMEIPQTLNPQYSVRDITSRLTYNVIKSCVDTLTSKITQQSPSIMFLTDGEDFFKQEKAQLASSFVDGCFYLTKFKREARRAFLDSSLWGIGAVKITADKVNNTMIAERVLPLELFIDDFDALYNAPRNLFQRKVINKDALKALFPDHVEEIDKAKTSSDGGAQRLYENTDVIEAWHLPTSKDSKDGKHLICIENCTLSEESWDKLYFPFAFLQFTDPLVGFWPAGLGEMLMGLQLEINKTLKVIRQIMEYSVPKLVVPAGSTIATQHLTNYVLDVIKVMGGGSPQVMQLAQANPQLFSYLATLYQKAYEIAGISQLSAQALKPAGLNSGRALRNFYQIESERYATTEQKWELFFVDAAYLFVQEAKDVPKFVATNVGKSGLTKINWKRDIDLKDEEFRIQAFPISALPKTPAGRLETITDLIAGQFITREQGLELLNYPDLSAVLDRDLSGRKLVRKIVDKILLHNEYTDPELFFDLAYCIEYAQKTYTLAKLNNAPDDTLDMLVRFMTESQAMKKSLEAPPPMPGLPGMEGLQGLPGMPGEEAMSPLAKPEAAPTSDLLPVNAGQAPAMAPPELIPQIPVPEGAAKEITRKQYSPSRNQTRILYSDGSEDIVDGRG